MSQARSWVRRGKRALKYLYYRWNLLLPVDRNLAVYCAYSGRGVRCNPGAIYEKARELAPGIRGVWIVRGDRAAAMPGGVDFVVEESLGYFKALARAKYLINNAHFADYLVKRKGAVHIQTHHGTPLKFMGMDGLTHNGRKGKGRDKLLRRTANWDFSLAANPHMTASWRTAYPGSWESLEYGYPRNDVLTNADPERGLRVRKELGIADGKRVILYAPTHRGRLADRFAGHLDVEQLAEQLGDDTVILLRTHYFYDKLALNAQGRVIEVTEYPVVEDLYLAADMLITDYSSAMFDFAILDRPIVIFASDWEQYRTSRGVYFDIFEAGPGVVATTPEELFAYFGGQAVDDEAAKLKRSVFRQRFCALEDGRASERVVRRIMLNEDVMHPAAELAVPRQPAAEQEAVTR